MDQHFMIEAAAPADIPGIVAVLEENLLANKDRSAVGSLERGGR